MSEESNRKGGVMEAFEKEFAKGATASGLYHVAKYWYKRGLLHAAEIAEQDSPDCIGCAQEQHDCRKCVGAAIRKEAGE